MSERDIRLYLVDIMDSGNAVLAFVKDLSFEEFCNDRKTSSAVIIEFEVIGEAVGKLPDELLMSSFVIRRNYGVTGRKTSSNIHI